MGLIKELKKAGRDLDKHVWQPVGRALGIVKKKRRVRIRIVEEKTNETRVLEIEAEVDEDKVIAAPSDDVAAGCDHAETTVIEGVKTEDGRDLGKLIVCCKCATVVG